MVQTIALCGIHTLCGFLVFVGNTAEGEISVDSGSHQLLQRRPCHSLVWGHGGGYITACFRFAEARVPVSGQFEQEANRITHA